MIFHKDNFKKLREENGLTMNDVAKTCGVSEGTVQKWEKRTNFQPLPAKIPVLAALLHCKESDLAQYGDFPDAPPELQKVVDDLAQKIADSARLRAEKHRKLLLEAIHNEIAKQFPNATETERDKILLELATGTIGEAIIFAEVGRMNSSIAAIADATREG